MTCGRIQGWVTWISGIFFAVAVWLLLRDQALAQGMAGLSNFSCSGSTASGNLISSADSCPKTLEPTNVFSFVVCHVETMTSQIFGNLYCGVISQLTPAVSAVLTLAVMFFGAGFTIGVIPATGREFLLFMIKITLVWVFATQAEYMIGYGYKLLVAGLRDGTAAAISVLVSNGGGGDGVQSMYKELDTIMARIIGLITDTAGAEWGDGGTTAGTVGAANQNPCENAIFAAIAVMGIAFPPLFLLAAFLFAKIVMVFLRACFGYLFSIVGIAFLLTLSPIFLSMALFKQTRPFFDKYLGYLVSFTLQIVIVFTFLAFVLSMDVSKLTDSITDLVVPVEEVPSTNSLRWPWQYCTLCKFTVQGKGASSSSIDLKNDQATCKNKNSKDPKDKFTILQTVTPATNEEDVNTLMRFGGAAAISLLILAYIVERLLDYAPAIAWRLASGLTGGVYAPQIGGPGSSKGGGGEPVTFAPLEYLETAGEGFVREFSRSSNSISGTAGGLQGAMRGLLLGQGSDEGLVNGFMRFFINPQRGSSSQ